MVELEAIDEKLDPLCKEMLLAVDQHGGEASTREIRTLIGEDSTTRTNYRINEYLEPLGLVEVHRPEPEGRTIPPNELTLTSRGEEVLNHEEESAAIQRDLGERVALIEDQLDGMQDTLIELQEEGVESDSETDEKILSLIQTVEDLEGEIGGLHEQVNNVEARVEEIESSPLFEEEMQGKIDAAIIMASISKQNFIKEHGEEELTTLFDEKDEELRTFT